MCSPESISSNLINITTRLSCQIIVFQVKRPITNGFQCVLHLHTTEMPAVITKVNAILDKKGEVSKKNPKCLVKGQSALISLTTSKAVAATKFADLKGLGRFTL